MKEQRKILLTIVIATIAIAVFVFAVGSMAIRYNNIGSKSTGNFLGNADQTSQEASNIKKAEVTPYSCTPTQNCGSPTCAAARGGSCGCGR